MATFELCPLPFLFCNLDKDQAQSQKCQQKWLWYACALLYEGLPDFVYRVQYKRWVQIKSKCLSVLWGIPLQRMAASKARCKGQESTRETCATSKRWGQGHHQDDGWTLGSERGQGVKVEKTQRKGKQEEDPYLPYAKQEEKISNILVQNDGV